ncbi:MAG TPA: NAD-binding protein [Candidatus Tumulicola sp.]|jgi:Trk K+ transport system NAD-binding subunit
MASETLIIVVGGDYLAFEICKEILKTAGHRVVLVWKHAEDRSARLLHDEAAELASDFGAAFRFLNEDPVVPATLRHAGLLPPEEQPPGLNFCVVAVSQDDRLNLRVSLLARDVNEHVRITLRQFNPLLGRKIQEGLRYNCTAISPAAHAAATYAASAVDPSCFYALRFPTLESASEHVVEGAELFAFSERTAAFFRIAGMTVADAERERRLRIVTVDGNAPYSCAGEEDRRDDALLERTLADDDRIIAFGSVAALKAAGESEGVRGARRHKPFAVGWREALAGIRRTEPVLRTAAGLSLLAYAIFVIFFGAVTHWNVWSASYFVMTVMEGSPDASLCGDCGSSGSLAWWQIVEMIGVVLVTLVGIAMVAIFTATVTSGLYAAAIRRTQGLRRIHRSGHVIVCGAGNVGSLVIDYLRQLGERVVVVEKDPDSLLVEMARDRKIDLLTGDATNDQTIAFCSPETAKSLVGVTNSDTANLETALGARSRMRESPDDRLHVVLRIDDLTFGRSIKRHFGVSSFSTTELSAATIAGLARFESTRGRFDLFADTGHPRSFQLAERFQGAENASPPAPPERPGYQVRWIPLYVWRETAPGKGEAIPIRKFAGEVESGDRLLFMVPLDQFSDETS